MNPGIITIILILANIAFSYKGFKDSAFYEKYKFVVDKVVLYKDYKIIITSGFLHANWMHLIFNVFGLFIFGSHLEAVLGPTEYFVIYLAGLVGGTLLELLIHKSDGGYSSIGASGAICGLLFAFIALFPNAGMGFIFIPVTLPAWIYGVGFVAYSIYGIRSKRENIGHEGHLGGALVGMFMAVLFHPAALIANYWAILLIAVPSVIFIYIIVTRPYTLLIDSSFFKKKKEYYSIDEKYNQEKFSQQKEIDRILDKISRKGMNSLSREEKRKLEDYSRS